MKPLMSYGALLSAIVLEVIGTTFLQTSEQFTRLVPTLIMAGCYLGAFYFLSLSLKAIPVGLAYAIWSGLGIVLIALVGYFVFRQSLDLAAMVGMSLIVAGVVILTVAIAGALSALLTNDVVVFANVFSKSIAH